MKWRLHVGVLGRQVGRKLGDLQLSPTPFAGLLVVSLVAHIFDDVFTVDFLFQPSQRPIDRFALLKFDFAQFKFTSFPRSRFRTADSASSGDDTHARLQFGPFRDTEADAWEYLIDDGRQALAWTILLPRGESPARTTPACAPTCPVCTSAPHPDTGRSQRRRVAP
jgi:hypothetical protein